jgi:uncharacterized protein YqgQ
MEFDFASYHEPLFKSEQALKLGQIHCAILVADNAYEKRAKVQKTEKNGEFDFSPIELTSFGQETLGHFVKWWVRKKVNLLDRIAEKMKEVLPYLDNLKRASLKLNQTSNVTKYEDLIDELKRFEEEHRKDIEALYSFVFWLNDLDELSPCILFTHPPWSATQLSDRYLKIEKCNEARIRACTEIVSGLWWHGMPTLAYVRNDIEGDWAENADPEYSGPSPITYGFAFPQASKKILYEFALYFQKIRDSVDLVQSEITSFTKEEILRSEEFLKLFVSRVLPNCRLETELWDFKETFSAWHNDKSEEGKLDFACNVASYANSRGGLLIIGIDDRSREIIGVEQPERKIQQSRSILERFMEPLPSPIQLFGLPLEDKNGKTVNCIIIKIPQTKDVIEVKEIAGGGRKVPVRVDNCIQYKSYREVSKMKKDVSEDNFLFSRELTSIVYSS